MRSQMIPKDGSTGTRRSLSRALPNKQAMQVALMLRRIGMRHGYDKVVAFRQHAVAVVSHGPPRKHVDTLVWPDGLETSA